VMTTEGVMKKCDVKVKMDSGVRQDDVQ
jgi:hypothetical protein